MSNACFSWLHLTDLHYGLKGQDCLWPNLRQPFLDDLEKLHDRCGPWHAVLFTGDLVQSGAPEQFTRMQQEFLSPLWERLQQLGSGDAKLLAVPGNHDLIRPDPTSDSPAADTLVRPDRFADVADRFWSDPAGSYRAVIDEAFAGYLEWWAGVPQRPQGLTCGTLPGDFATTLTIAGRHIGIIGLNTAFLQLAGGDYKERLVWSVQQLHALFPDGIDRWLPMHDQCLLLTHHGPEWLTEAAREHGKLEIAPAGQFAAHLFGHMHETKIQHSRLGGSDRAVRQLQGCSVFGMEKHGDPPEIDRAHGYCAGRMLFDDDGAALRLWPRRATKGTGRWRYIPDHDNAELDEDNGTKPDRLHCPNGASGANRGGGTERKVASTAVADQVSTPLSDWTRIDQAYLNDLEPLTPGEVLRYFDGAVPTWRHALCDGIPRRHRIAELVTALEKAREDRSGCSLQLIRAAGGEGKTTLQLQTAVDLLRGGDWAVLWRANPELPLPIAQLGALDQSHNWLIVADDA